MKLYYDFHIHTALSPCGDINMTPNNILNMAQIKGLDAIAITDHNSIRNCHPCLELGQEKGIIVIPGMEIQTKEEVHLICLFRELQNAIEFQNHIYSFMTNEKNNPNFFGRQLILNKYDDIVEEETRLLISSVNLKINEIFSRVIEHKGIVIPAHIDKSSYSILSNLGFIPRNLDIKTLEISKKCDKINFLSENKYLDRYKLITNSDAHYLGDISERNNNYIEVREKNINSIFDVITS